MNLDILSGVVVVVVVVGGGGGSFSYVKMYIGLDNGTVHLNAMHLIMCFPGNDSMTVTILCYQGNQYLL